MDDDNEGEEEGNHGGGGMSFEEIVDEGKEDEGDEVVFLSEAATANAMMSDGDVVSSGIQIIEIDEE